MSSESDEFQTVGAARGVSIAAAVWGGQRGGQICIWGRGKNSK